jgi:WD40 repeat protein
MLWDLNTGKIIRTFYGPEQRGNVVGLAVSPDGRRLLSCINRDDNWYATLWDLATCQAIKTYNQDRYFIWHAAAFNSDGTKALMVSSDYTIKLWDLAPNRVRTLAGHSSKITSAVFSPDDRYVLSGSDDGTIRLWDAGSGQEIAAFISFTNGEWITITPDGHYNASVNGDHYLNVRVGNNVYGVDQYRSTFYNPEMVAGLLGPADQRTGSQQHTERPEFPAAEQSPAVE